MSTDCKKPTSPTLFADPACWEFKRQHPDAFASFGCGPGGIGDYLVPDTVWGLSIKNACRIHDWGYRFAPDNDEAGRKRHDEILKNNAIRIVYFYSKNRVLLKLRLLRVRTYYSFVRFGGGPAYWEERNKEYELQPV